jgi:omega-hydroxy-beta-dihydromenaquinone-9 sulfotransferase
MAFEDLECDPHGEIKATYTALNLPGFTEFEPKLCNYPDSIKDYKKNCFEPLSEDKRTLVAQRWKRCFTEWGYEI